MDVMPWFWIWIIAAALLFIGEMLSLSFFLLPFAIGAVFAAICNVGGLSLIWQLVVFIIISTLVLVGLRPFAHRITRKASNVKAGAERLVGMQGVVIEGQSAAGEFRVVVGGEHWNASSWDGASLAPDTPIDVLAINSNSLVVRALPKVAQADTHRDSGPKDQKPEQVKTPLDAPQFVDVEQSHKKS